MPFDSGETRELKTPALALLDAVIETLSDERRWGRGHYEKQGRFCIAGALRHHGSERQTAYGRVYKTIVMVVPEHKICSFNDALTTTHAMVMAKLREARAVLVEEEKKEKVDAL